MRKVAHGTVWFEAEDREKVLELMQSQCSAMRSAYQAIHKHGLTGNDVRKHVKQNYMNPLNQRYVNDAVSQAKTIQDEHVIFGGGRLWDRLQNGSITREQWQRIRNNQLYSRGDRSKQGNPNIRIDQEEGKLWVNDPSKRGKWIEGSLHLPDKWNPDTECYGVRILLQEGKFRVQVLWEEEAPTQIGTGGKGTIGIDVNPDGVALAEILEDGNLLSHQYIRAQRLQFASENKRTYDVRQLAVEVVDVAKSAGKALVVERLDFGKDRSKGCKKFRRMKHNFLHRQILDAIQSRAAREGIPVRGINPAFSSILGKLKYEQMYSLNRHTAAALVIARRGLGIKERQDFTVTPRDSGSDSRVNLEGRSREHTLSQKAYSFLSGCFLKDKAAELTASVLAPGLKPGIRTSAGGIPAGETQPTTGRLRKELHEFFSGGERRPSKPV